MMVILSNLVNPIALSDVKGFIATKKVDSKAQLLETLCSNSPKFTIHEDIKSIEFIKGIPKDIKEKGRSFSENIEIQWQKLDGRFQIVFLSEDKSNLTNFDISEKSFDLKSVSYMLWGGYKQRPENDKNIFIEVRIPKCLEYPIPATKENERLYIKAYHYIEDDVVQFTRYLNVISETEGQKRGPQ